LANGFAAAIGLYDDVDRFDALQVLGITLFAPVGRSRNAERGNAVVPEGVTVRLPLDHDHLSRRSRLCQAVEPVEAWLSPGLPAEAIASE